MVSQDIKKTRKQIMEAYDSPLLTLSEAAEFLRVHRNTLRNWDTEDILKAHRFGKRGDRRYSKKELVDFIRKDDFQKLVGKIEIK